VRFANAAHRGLREPRIAGSLPPRPAVFMQNYVVHQKNKPFIKSRLYFRKEPA
jgi:hypothetical protein